MNSRARKGHSARKCSTALTPGHLGLLGRLEAKELVLLLDGDNAGRNAVERLAGALLAGGVNSRVAVLPEGERRSQIVNLIDLGPTMLEALGAPALPNAQGRSLLGVAKDAATPWLDETFSEYCTDGMAAWAGTEPVQQRMIRRGRWKLVYYHGHPPQLFDLEEHPAELNDLASDPRHAGIRDALVARVVADWDPEAIAREIAPRVADKRLLQAWARTVNPPESHRWPIRTEDNRLDQAAE